METRATFRLIARQMALVPVLLCASNAAAQTSSESNVPVELSAAAPAAPMACQDTRLPAEERANQAFRLMAEGLRLANDDSMLERARDKLLEAWDCENFPNIAFHLARILDRLDAPQQARDQLSRYFGTAEAWNVNFEQAKALQARFMDQDRVPAPAPGSGALDSKKAQFPTGAAVFAGTGALMLLASITTALLANAAEGELERNCPSNRCDAHLNGVAERGRNLKLATNILLVAGGASLAAGSVWWVHSACTTRGCSAVFSAQF